MAMTPVVPSYAVDRPLLRRRLDQGLTRPLTLVVAPAGSGKSVLLSQWAATRPDLAFVWLQLEPADDDASRFAQRLLRGLAVINPAFAELAAVAAMSSRGLGGPLIEQVEPLAIELPDIVLVLDDLHHLSNPELVADLARFLETMAPQVHLVLSTRIDPPLAWNHYRRHRNLTEIRQSDLAFGHADSTELLERITGRPIGADGVTALLGRTEGWAAGLQLAGVTLRTHADTEDFIVRFAGDDRLVADYLSEEVLNAQPERRRAVLLRSAVLDQMSAPLVEHVTGVPGAQLMLEELERESMFLVPLDTHREWFRFHHLFRDLLHFRLRAEDPTAEADLLRRAAAWYLDRGDVVPAVEYLLRAEEWEQAVEVIFSRGSEIFEQGEMTTVIRWIRQLPESLPTTRWDITLLLGALLVAEGQAVAAEDILRKVTTAADVPYGTQVCAQSLLAALAQWRSRPETSITAATRAVQMLQNLDGAPVPRLLGLTDPESLETLATVSGGRAHFLAGHLGPAREWIERALTTAGAGYSIWRISALGSLALLDAWCGSIADAEMLAAEALGVARDVGVLAHPAVADAYLAMAFAALERGNRPERPPRSTKVGSGPSPTGVRSCCGWVASRWSSCGPPKDIRTRRSRRWPPRRTTSVRRRRRWSPSGCWRSAVASSDWAARPTSRCSRQTALGNRRRRWPPRWWPPSWPSATSTGPGNGSKDARRRTIRRYRWSNWSGCCCRRGWRKPKGPPTTSQLTWPTPCSWPNGTDWSRRAFGPDPRSSA